VVTHVEYVLQYRSEGDRNVWMDGGGPWGAINEDEARKRLDWVRSAPQYNLFPRDWQLVKRTTTEEVLDG
jgi:hypothetical protein